MYVSDIFKKSVSALIATILLIVVAVGLIAIILTWGKSFTNTNLTNTNDLLNASASDAQYYLTIEDGLNGRYLAKYNPPMSFDKKSITITRYRLFDYNNIIDFNVPIDINAGNTNALDMGIINSSFDLVLYLDDNSIITKQNIKNTNRSPRPGTCPTGFISVPGNYLYNTVESNSGGFCVAKYEMKVDQNGDGVGDSNTSCQNSSYGTWDNNASTCAYTVGSRVLVSSASGYPLANISQIEAIIACQSIGGHLITNNEWMTLARNIEMVSSNWSNGIIGNGYIYAGHSDSSPNAALAADTNDNNGYYLTGETNGYQKRTLTLTNGEIIWDLSGNIFEITSLLVPAKDQPDAVYDSNGGTYTGTTWFDYSSGGIGLHIINDGNDSVLGYNSLRLLTSPNYNSLNHIGRVYSSSNSGSSTNYIAARGFGFSYPDQTGVLGIILSALPTTKSYSYGFRCVYVP